MDFYTPLDRLGYLLVNQFPYRWTLNSGFENFVIYGVGFGVIDFGIDPVLQLSFPLLSSECVRHSIRALSDSNFGRADRMGCPPGSYTKVAPYGIGTQQRQKQQRAPNDHRH